MQDFYRFLGFAIAGFGWAIFWSILDRLIPAKSILREPAFSVLAKWLLATLKALTPKLAKLFVLSKKG